MVENNFLPGNGNDVRVRPRQMIRLLHPLEFEPRLSLIAWDEFFIRANSMRAGGQSGFDQNRAFAGIGWTFNKNFRTEAGYLNQYLDDATHTNNTMHHLIMSSLFINFPDYAQASANLEVIRSIKSRVYGVSFFFGLVNYIKK